MVHLPAATGSTWSAPVRPGTSWSSWLGGSAWTGRRVVFHGRLADDAFAPRMAAAAAAVSASGHEAFGMAVADALAAGIPAVASFIPAHRELAVMAGDGVPLWLVNPDDEVALADALAVGRRRPAGHPRQQALPTWSDVVLSTREVYASVVPRARHAR